MKNIAVILSIVCFHNLASAEKPLTEFDKLRAQKLELVKQEKLNAAREQRLGVTSAVLGHADVARDSGFAGNLKENAAPLGKIDFGDPDANAELLVSFAYENEMEACKGVTQVCSIPMKWGRPHLEDSTQSNFELSLARKPMITAACIRRSDLEMREFTIVLDKLGNGFSVLASTVKPVMWRSFAGCVNPDQY